MKIRSAASVLPSVDDQTAQETLGMIENTVKNISWQMVAILLCLIVASYVIIRVLVAAVDRTMERAGMDRGIRTFLRSGLKVLLWLVAICILLGYIGVPMTSLVAVLSVLGLAVSLAVQGILSNLAGGLMLVSTRPFAAGDYVDVGEIGGTVKAVGLVYTVLVTPDNKVINIPNGSISSKTLVNYSAEEKRRVDLKISVSYDAKMEEVKACIGKVIGEHPKTFPTPEPFVRIFSYDDSAIQYVVRCWCASEDYWTVYFDIQEGIKVAFDKAGIEMTYPHVNVHMVP